MSSPGLSREEHVEQAYFFRVLRERLKDHVPVQEVLLSIREEVLATTRLPMAIDFLSGEIQHHGRLGRGMDHLKHYFTPFQSFIMSRAEEDSARLDFSIALQNLEKEADYLSRLPVEPAALFIYHFECLARNRLGYDAGIKAIAADPNYSSDWRAWITRIRMELGTREFADLIYSQSQQYVEDRRRELRGQDPQITAKILFDAQAGRIARANLGKDPLYMFAALQRQLGYPAVPRQAAAASGPIIPPQVEMRFQRIEARLGLVEQEQRGGIDLSNFFQGPGSSAGTDGEDIGQAPA